MYFQTRTRDQLLDALEHMMREMHTIIADKVVVTQFTTLIIYAWKLQFTKISYFLYLICIFLADFNIGEQSRQIGPVWRGQSDWNHTVFCGWL